MKNYGIDLTAEELQGLLQGDELICTFNGDEGNEEAEVHVRIVEDTYG